MFDHKDGGYKSRKMVMAYVAMFMIAMGFLASEHSDILKTLYGEYVAGVLGATTIYVGGNTVVKWMSPKSPTPQVDPKA